MKKEYACIVFAILFLLALPLNCIQSSYAELSYLDVPAVETPDPEPPKVVEEDVPDYCQDPLDNMEQDLKELKEDLKRLKRKRSQKGSL